MTKIETSVTIGAPLDTVYAFAMDWQNLTRYHDYIQEVKPTTEKTIGEGARFALRVKFMGRMMDAEWEGIEHTENEGWAFSATLMGKKATKRWRFTPVDGSTQVTFTLEYKPSPPIIGWLLDVILIRPQWRRIYKRSFQNLKQLIEAEIAPVPNEG